MNKHADKNQENKSRAAAHKDFQSPQSSSALFQFKDHRPEAILQREIQEMADNSPQVLQKSAIQEMANNSIRSGKTAQLKATSENPIQQKPEVPNKTGLPDQLKTGIENLSGISMDDVKVHRNSDQPAQLQAHAFAQGTDIHLGPGQEKHLPHEAWHVVQQKQGRVKPTIQAKGIAINDHEGLEKEADVMGAKAESSNAVNETAARPVNIQMVEGDKQEKAAVQRKLLTPIAAALNAQEAHFANPNSRGNISNDWIKDNDTADMGLEWRERNLQPATLIKASHPSLSGGGEDRPPSYDLTARKPDETRAQFIWHVPHFEDIKGMKNWFERKYIGATIEELRIALDEMDNNESNEDDSAIRTLGGIKGFDTERIEKHPVYVENKESGLTQWMEELKTTITGIAAIDVASGPEDAPVREKGIAARYNEYSGNDEVKTAKTDKEIERNCEGRSIVLLNAVGGDLPNYINNLETDYIEEHRDKLINILAATKGRQHSNPDLELQDVRVLEGYYKFTAQSVSLSDFLARAEETVKKLKIFKDTRMDLASINNAQDFDQKTLQVHFKSRPKPNSHDVQKYTDEEKKKITDELVGFIYNSLKMRMKFVIAETGTFGLILKIELNEPTTVSLEDQLEMMRSIRTYPNVTNVEWV